jgi:hypothetical protein
MASGDLRVQNFPDQLSKICVSDRRVFGRCLFFHNLLAAVGRDPNG